MISLYNQALSIRQHELTENHESPSFKGPPLIPLLRVTIVLQIAQLRMVWLAVSALRLPDLDLEEALLHPACVAL